MLKSWNPLSFVNISPTLVIDTSMERSSRVLQHGNPKIGKNFQKNFKFEFWLVTKTCTYMMTSGMQRRPFEGRHLVSYYICVRAFAPNQGRTSLCCQYVAVYDSWLCCVTRSSHVCIIHGGVNCLNSVPYRCYTYVLIIAIGSIGQLFDCSCMSL